MLKTGSDAFLETGQPPTVAVCDRRYVFSSSTMNSDLDPNGPCPPDDVAAIRAPQSASADQATDPFVQKYKKFFENTDGSWPFVGSCSGCDV
jgi:murein L,D-transpeptidase YafK